MDKLYQLASLFLIGASLSGLPAYLRQINPELNRWALSCAAVACLCLVVAGLVDEFLAHFLNQPKGFIWGAIFIIFASLVCGVVFQG